VLWRAVAVVGGRGEGGEEGEEDGESLKGVWRRRMRGRRRGEW